MALTFHSSNHEEYLKLFDQTLQEIDTTIDFNDLLFCQNQDNYLPSLDQDSNGNNSASSFILNNPLFEPEPKFQPKLEYDPFMDNFWYSDSTYTDLLDYTTMSLSPEFFPSEEIEPHPKRQKCYENQHYVNTNTSINLGPSSLDDYIVNSCLVQENPTWEFEAPLVTTDAVKKSMSSSTTGANLSVQSVAARERRRKISEKTQELGKLIPGGSKMNTAEMFQAASKYVKFLQAQVGILQLVNSLDQENKGPIMQKETGGLQFLLASSTVQKKLSSEEMCLVPKDFVKAMSNDNEIQSNPIIHEELDQLLSDFN